MSLTDQAIAFGEGKVLAADVRAMLGTLDHGQVYGVLHALLEGDARGLIDAVRHLAEQGPDWSGVLSEMLNVLHRVAIAQALPEAVDNGQGDRERVLELARVLPSEDVQFYYQMGLIGRRDLPLSPDPRSGFEMVLLRMLAFRPADTHDAPRVALKPLGISQATADPATNPVAGTALAAPVSDPVAIPPAPPSAPAVAAPLTLPVSVPAAVGSQVPSATESVEEPAVQAPPAEAAPAVVVNLPWDEPAQVPVTEVLASVAPIAGGVMADAPQPAVLEARQVEAEPLAMTMMSRRWAITTMSRWMPSRLTMILMRWSAASLPSQKYYPPPSRQQGLLLTGWSCFRSSVCLG